mgnify:CR=1 FL=1
MHLFSLAKSQELKTAGMLLAASNSQLLEQAQDLAVTLARAREDRTISADDVYAALEAAKMPTDLGPAAGSLFRGRRWKFSGRYINSTRASNHARTIRCWILK